MIIFDDGLGIPFVFEKNNISFSEDSNAIKMALEGTTTTKGDISRGFGLKTTGKIINALKGEMKIISRRGILNVDNTEINSYDTKKELNGTLLYINLKTPDKDLNIYDYLE